MNEDSLDWRKLQQNSEKIGIRDGIEEGRNENFQRNFDEGYKSGFRNGFELGRLKGQMKHTKSTLHSELEFTKRGNCCICKDSNTTGSSNDKQILQWKSTESVLKNCKTTT